MQPNDKGVQILVEMGLSIVESAQPEIIPAEYDEISSKILEFIIDYTKNPNNHHLFDELKNLLILKFGDDSAAIRVKGILDLPDQPFASIDQQNRLRVWNKFEDERLLGGIYRYGLDDWNMVSQYVGGNRTKGQCLQRWSRGLNPKICKKMWSQTEDDRLQQLVQTHGENNWATIANIFGNRSDIQCKYHYKQISRHQFNNTTKDNNNFLGLERTLPASSSTTALLRQQQMLQKLFQPSSDVLQTSGGLNFLPNEVQPIINMKSWSSMRGTAIALQPLPFLSPKLRLDGATQISAFLKPIDT